MLRFAKRFGGDTKFYGKPGSHNAWSPRQRGKEKVVSEGVFKDAIHSLSSFIGIPENQLKIYFKGSGQLFRKFEKTFKKTYNI